MDEFLKRLDEYGRSIAFGSRVEQNEARARVVALYEAKDSGSISDRIGQMLRDMIAANERLTAELAAERQRAEGLERDAERYRFLRLPGMESGITPFGWSLLGGVNELEFDQRVDNHRANAPVVLR